jgi:hypothetical protein
MEVVATIDRSKATDALWRSLRVETSAELRIAAAVALHRLDSDAAEPVEVLSAIAARGDDEARFAAVSALGPLVVHRAAPTLIGRLQDRLPRVRIAAARAVGRFRPLPPEAVEALITSSTDRDPGVRSACVAAIGESGVRDERAIGAVRSRTRDSSSDVRTAAFEALERLGVGVDTR